MPPLLAWIPAFVAAVLLLVALLLLMQARRKPGRGPLPRAWDLSPRPVFTSDERRLYRQLREALPQHVILAKLPLVRFCQPLDTKRVRYWYELLAGSHVAFAICSPSGRVLAAVDIETERSSSRRSRQIKTAVLETCRVRYLRCPPGEVPSVAALQGLLPLPVLNSAMPVSAPMPLSPVDQSRERLSSTVASRRQQRRQGQWPDSAFADSRFADSSFAESQYSSLQPAPPEPARAPAPQGGGVVVDGPVPLASRR